YGPAALIGVAESEERRKTVLGRVRPPHLGRRRKAVWQLPFHLRGRVLRVNVYETFQGVLRDGERNARHYIQKNELRVNFLEKPRRVCCRKRIARACVAVSARGRRAARVVRCGGYSMWSRRCPRFCFFVRR